MPDMLVDMIVTEVSLVTKAANNRKFLLFKSRKPEGLIDMSQEVEALTKEVRIALTSLGDKLDSMAKGMPKFEMPKEATQDDVVKAINGLTEKFTGVFEKVKDDKKAVTDELETLRTENEGLKKQLKEAKEAQIPDELEKELDELLESIPDEEAIKKSISEIVEKIVGLKST